MCNLGGLGLTLSLSIIMVCASSHLRNLEATDSNSMRIVLIIATSEDLISHTPATHKTHVIEA